jgi:heme/copper-type cytochrome/quinol oxidase subunit 2
MKAVQIEEKSAMIRMPSIPKTVTFFLATAIAWFAAVQAQAADSGGKPGEGNATDYLISYLVVVLGIVLGVLLVANVSHRRSREGPAGYVEKKIVSED